MATVARNDQQWYNWIVYFCFIFPSLDVIISCRGHVVEISVCVFFSGQILVLIRGWNIYIYKFVFLPRRFCELTIIFTSSQASRLLARFPKTGCFISKEADSVRVDWNILPFSHRSKNISVLLKVFHWRSVLLSGRCTFSWRQHRAL